MSSFNQERAWWKVHLKNLFEEVLTNDGTQILKIPFQITHGLICQIADLAVEIDDPRLLHLLCRLQVYEISDPSHENYEKDTFTMLEERIIKEYGSLNFGTKKTENEVKND